jgi:glutamate carboxypeptidase
MRIFIAFLFSLISTVVWAQLSQTEQHILERIDANYEESLRFLEDNVNMNTGTLNLEGIKKLGAKYMDVYDELGFDVRWIAQDEVDRAGHFFAEHPGNSGKKLLLIGHLDTVFEPESPFQKFEMIDETSAIGPGITDMKAGNVMIYYALKALFEAGALEDAQIIVAYTGDEEKAGSPTTISRADLVDAAQRSDIALGFEGSTGLGYATVARRASESWILDVNGLQAHSSGIFSERVGAGAVYEAARIVNRFYEELQEENLTFNVGVFLGANNVEYNPAQLRGFASGKTNIVPKRAVVHGDLRFLTLEQGDRAYAKMQAIVDDHLPQTEATITFNPGYPPMEPNEGNLQVLSVYNAVSIALGLGSVEPFDPGRRGAADISFVAHYVDALDGLGAMGGGAHSPNEQLHLSSYKMLTKRAALLIYRLTQTDN